MDLATAARWIGYLGVLGLAGAGTFQAIVHARVAPRHPSAAPILLGKVRAAGFMAALFVVASQVLKLLAQLRSFTDPGTPITREVFNLVLFESGWGHNWQLQSAVAAVVLILVLLVRSTWALVPMALVLVFLAPLTGHALEHPWGANFGVVLHGIHQLGGGAWLGTLILVLVAGYGGTRGIAEGERHGLIATIVHAYSPIALIAVSMAVVAGLVLALAYLASWSDIWTTGYGRALIAKTLLLGGTAGIGAYNWRRVRPTLGLDISSRRLYRSATAELVLGAMLLGATALLAGMGAPGLE